MDKKNILVSVVVPIYNVEPFLKRCLDSIVNQTYKHLEIILVDDGSPDNCGKICDNYAKQDKRISVIHKQNGGLMAAWIDGLKRATGDYVYFVDSDDWIELYSIQDYIDVVEKYSPDVVIDDYYLTSSKEKLHKSALTNSKIGFLENEDFNDFKQKFMQYSLQFEYYRWNKLFKREILLDNIKYCDTRIGLFEDINIVVALMLNIKNAYILEKPGYNYFVREDSMIRASFKERNIVDRERALSAILNILKNKNIDDKELVCKLNYFFITCVIGEIILAKKNKKENFEKLVNSYLINNELKPIITNYLGKYKKLIYKNFVKKNFVTVRLLRSFARVVRKVQLHCVLKKIKS